MSIIKILEIGLKAEGFDGLVCPGICGCKIDDLSPGSCLSDSCEPGYLQTHSETGEWVIGINNEAWTDADIERCISECS